MAEITAAMVKELRERTQAGMMECKKALVESGGDLAAAAELLQKKGAIKAGAIAGKKVAADGAIAVGVSADGARGVLVELNCQTDFVARGEDFQALLKLATATALAQETSTAEALNSAVPADGGPTLGERAAQLTARSGEKHELRRVALVSTQGVVKGYVHTGARIGVLVALTSSDPRSPKVQDLADELTLQVASMKPLFLHRREVPADTVARQREILSAQLAQEDEATRKEPEAYLARVRQLVVDRAREEDRDPGDDAAVEAEAQRLVTEDESFKSSLVNFQREAEKVGNRTAAVRDKILEGRVAKWLTEVVLLDQVSIKESKKTVGKLLSEVGVPGTELQGFLRFEVGEGVEKAVAKDFATEVAELASQTR
jgi:elongation factor Ts